MSSRAVGGEVEERTTRPGFALQGASGSSSVLLFQGAGEQEQQSNQQTRGHAQRGANPRRGRRGRGRAAQCRWLRPHKQREDSVMQAAGPPQTEPVFRVDLCSFTDDCYMVAKV